MSVGDRMPHGKIKRGIILAIILAALWIPEAKSQEPIPAPVKASQTPQNKPDDNKNITQSNQRGTDQEPFVIKLVPSQPINIGTSDQSKTNDEKSSSDWWMIVFNGLLALFTFLLWRSTHKLWKSTHKLAETSLEQSKDMKDSIAESSRAANAMEDVAKSIFVSAQAATESVTNTKGIAERQKTYGEMQLRSYLTIIFGNFFPQDRRLQTKCEILVYVRNTGNTPAHAVNFSVRAKIMNFPLPDEIDLTLPVPTKEAAACVSSGQQHVMRATLDDFIADEKMEEIMSNNGQKFYVYGTVSYKDVFGNPHYTNFCQFIMRDVKGNFSTINAPRHNDQN